MKIKAYLEQIRRPQDAVPFRQQAAETAVIILLGLLLGILQKWLDSAPSNVFPPIIQLLDIRNYFGRLAVWILLATVISVYAKSPLRASVNTFSFFLSMLAGYYLYCYYMLGFLPKAYLAIWIVLSFVSFFLAYLCWYAKGAGPAAICISSIILGVLLAQAVSLTQGFYVYHFSEVLTWVIGAVLLRRKPKESAMEIGLAIAVAFLYQLFLPHWG